jgi:hypothetical protein
VLEPAPRQCFQTSDSRCLGIALRNAYPAPHNWFSGLALRTEYLLTRKSSDYAHLTLANPARLINNGQNRTNMAVFNGRVEESMSYRKRSSFNQFKEKRLLQATFIRLGYDLHRVIHSICGKRLAMQIAVKMHLVPMAGLEPAQLSPPPPQDGVSTNSTTSAQSQDVTGVHRRVGQAQAAERPGNRL